MPKLCQFENCKKQANYGTEGEKKIFCREHKTVYMKNMSAKMCEFECCKKQPGYGFIGTPAKFCVSHKLDGMVDLKSTVCEFIGCNCSAIFNFNGEKKRRFCSTHKLDGMVDVVHKKCQYFNCDRQPNYNFIGEKAKYCVNHKITNMVCVCSINCKNVPCQARSNKKYKNYCAFCFQYLFPLDPLTFQIRCKTKELAVRDFINANYHGFNHDKILEYGGCDCLTRRRIDHRKLIGNTLLCIETDENQHKSYSKEDEEARYNDLLVNFTCKYIIIRFNPDSYVNKKGVKTNPYISARLEELKKEMDKQIKRIENNENSELLEVVHLYYDGYK